MQVITIIILLLFIPIKSEAGSFWTKLIYAGHDNKQEWEQAQKDKFLTTGEDFKICLLYTSPSPRDRTRSRMPSSA